MSGNKLGGVTDGQLAALVALDQGQCEITNGMNASGYVNVRSARTMAAAGFADRLDTLIGEVYVITPAGRRQLAIALDARMRSAARMVPRMKTRSKQQPLGALCQHCHYKPARPNKKYPHLSTNYCSDACEQNESHARTYRAAAAIANEIREMMGMPADRGRHFTVPELRLMRSILQQKFGLQRTSRKRRKDAGIKQPPRRKSA